MNLGSTLLNLDYYPVVLTAANGNPKVLNISGSSVRCVGATADFLISFDGQAFVPFGVARRIAPLHPDTGEPLTFRSIAIKPDGAAVENSIILVVGDAGYDDGRVALYPQQKVRIESAARIVGADKVWADGGAGYMAVLNEPGTFRVNIRNTDTTRNLRFNYGDMGGADDAALIAGNGGYLLGPGENVDCDVLQPTTNWAVIAPWRFRAAVGQTFTVTFFCYKQ